MSNNLNTKLPANIRPSLLNPVNSCPLDIKSLDEHQRSNEFSTSKLIIFSLVHPKNDKILLKAITKCNLVIKSYQLIL